MAIATPLPQISISPAPPLENFDEPFSPFPWTAGLLESDDSFRPKHLTPPPVHAKFVKSQSPLRPVAQGKGLERERFEALLKSSRERNAIGSKGLDLRKEVAIKAHKNKQGMSICIVLFVISFFWQWKDVLCSCRRSSRHHLLRQLPCPRPHPNRPPYSTTRSPRLGSYRHLRSLILSTAIRRVQVPCPTIGSLGLSRSISVFLAHPGKKPSLRSEPHSTSHLHQRPSRLSTKFLLASKVNLTLPLRLSLVETASRLSLRSSRPRQPQNVPRCPLGVYSFPSIRSVTPSLRPNQLPCPNRLLVSSCLPSRSPLSVCLILGGCRRRSRSPSRTFLL